MLDDRVTITTRDGVRDLILFGYQSRLFHSIMNLVRFDSHPRLTPLLDSQDCSSSQLEFNAMLRPYLKGTLLIQ